MIFGTNLAILAAVFPVGERGKAMGINVTAVYVGLAAGPFLGGLLTHYFGWRSIFAFLVPMGIISLVLINRKMKGEWRDAHGEHFDWIGSLVYGVSLASVMYGFSKLPTPAGWILTSIGLILMPLFIWIEKKSKSPVFDISLIFKNKVFAFSSLAALIHYAATSAIGFFLSLYLQYIKVLDSRQAGFILIFWPLTMAILSLVAGKLSDNRNPGVLASIGMGITSAGLLALCSLTSGTSILFIILILVILGLGFGLFSSPNTNAIMSSVEKKQLGNASGMIATVRMVGQTMSMGIAMMLVALFMGKAKISPENYYQLIAAMKTGFIIFSVLCIAGVFASLARNNDLKR
jgi:MFS family permease